MWNGSEANQKKKFRSPSHANSRFPVTILTLDFVSSFCFVYLWQSHVKVLGISRGKFRSEVDEETMSYDDRLIIGVRGEFQS